MPGIGLAVAHLLQEVGLDAEQLAMGEARLFDLVAAGLLEALVEVELPRRAVVVADGDGAVAIVEGADAVRRAGEVPGAAIGAGRARDAVAGAEQRDEADACGARQDLGGGWAVEGPVVVSAMNGSCPGWRRTGLGGPLQPVAAASRRAMRCEP
ncbi:hypothetical protein [Dankookia rubra]|uniref:hypothetical protein n=1 Tax=Dankookia rubra TaxID=1442381 RepID=UPI00140A2628|nr:hypothetical protein [Dankookia rubra]